jgi:hypothetical protein
MSKKRKIDINDFESCNLEKIKSYDKQDIKNFKYEDGNLLHYVAKNCKDENSSEIMEYLIDTVGLNIRSTRRNVNPLEIAIKYNNLNAVKFLGDRIIKTDNDAFQYLRDAFDSNNDKILSIVDYLIDKKPNVLRNPNNDYGGEVYLLNDAAWAKSNYAPQIVQKIIERGELKNRIIPEKNVKYIDFVGPKGTRL